jgi:chemotaxis protein methyltransferase CheR
MVDFRLMNLVDPWPPLQPADIVLFRNVLIYLDVAARKEILAKVRRLLKPDGYMLLGAAESTINLDDAYRRIDLESTSIYRLHSTN